MTFPKPNIPFFKVKGDTRVLFKLPESSLQYPADLQDETVIIKKQSRVQE